MARRKETISQVDFGYGATRPESVEREDTPLVLEGLKEALNTVGLTTGSLEGRPGLLHIGDTPSEQGIEVDLGQGRVFDIHVEVDGVAIYGSDGNLDTRFATVTWDSLTAKYGTDTFDARDFWIVSDPDTSSILIGAQPYPTHALSLTDGVWSFGLLNYYTGLNGAIGHPYWPYYPEISITPSARTGAITVTASASLWTTAFEGLRIRYGDKEILLDTFTSTTVMQATVIEELPPTFDFTVASASGYQVGDAVEHETLGGQGIITDISGTTVTVRATTLWDGFAASNKLIAPNAKQTISAQVAASPGATFLWDIQAASPVHGYPGWGTRHKGRVYLNQYPKAPNAFAVSVAGRVDDFTQGVKDGDGFMETIGSNSGGDLLYIISAEDLLFFTTRGLYYQPTRGGEDVTPSSIGPISFSQIGCSRVTPVTMDDGAIFVDSVGEQVHAAVLAGDYYKSWATENISQYHNHLISSPVFLGATKYGSDRPENFVFVVNSDGTAAVCQWDRAQNKIGWRPWETSGTFLSIYQAFGSVWAIVDRSIDAFLGRFRERFQEGVYLDCTSGLGIDGNDGTTSTGAAYFDTLTKAPAHLIGTTPAAYLDGWDFGDLALDGSGDPIYTFPSYAGVSQIGIPFSIRVTPWPRRSVNTQRGTRDVKRMLKAFITVQNTLAFEYENYKFGGYRVADDLSVPPVLRSEEFSAITGGRQAFDERPITVDRPGPFLVLKIRYRVTI